MTKTTSRRVTLVDIARKAGVSRATVSLVLRDSPRVAESTRARVQSTMHSLGYVYNRGAAVLRSRRSDIVGLVLTDITNPFYSSFVSGMSEVLQENGRVLLLADSKETIKFQTTIVDRLLEHNVDGLVICPAEHSTSADLQRILASHVPSLLAMRSIDGAPLDYVGPNYERGMQIAVEYLYGLGHRHIAFAGHIGETSAAADRYTGFQRSASAFNLKPKLIDCPTTYEGGRQAAAYIADHKRLTACVCYSDQVALGMLRGLADAGIKVGREFAVVGMDNLREDETSSPPLTTLSVQAKAIGRRAGDLILRRIAGSTEPTERVVIEPELIVRQSTCPPRGRAN